MASHITIFKSNTSIFLNKKEPSLKLYYILKNCTFFVRTYTYHIEKVFLNFQLHEHIYKPVSVMQ